MLLFFILLGYINLTIESKTLLFPKQYRSKRNAAKYALPGDTYRVSKNRTNGAYNTSPDQDRDLGVFNFVVT